MPMTIRYPTAIKYCLDNTKEVLVDESITCIDWFRNNKMQANPDKFQAIMLGKLGFENCKKVQVGKDQEKAQSEKDSHSKNRGGKKPN